MESPVFCLSSRRITGKSVAGNYLDFDVSCIYAAFLISKHGHLYVIGYIAPACLGLLERVC